MTNAGDLPFLTWTTSGRNATRRKKDSPCLGCTTAIPLHPAIPSEHDLAVALPYFSYIIVSVQPEGTAHVRSWQLDDSRQFDEEHIVALPDNLRVA